MSEEDELYNLTSSLLEGDEYKGYDPEDYSSYLDNLEAGYGSGSSFHTPNNYSPISTSSSDSFQTIENNIEGDGDQPENAEENVQNFVEGNAQNANPNHHFINIDTSGDEIVVSTHGAGSDLVQAYRNNYTSLSGLAQAGVGLGFGATMALPYVLRHFS